jgi:hypothetical protein
MGLSEDEIRTAIKYAKSQNWLEQSKLPNTTRDWLSITPGGKAAAKS